MRKNSNTSFTTSSSKMAEIPNIKVVRLQSGEDIIADIVTDNESTILNNPMVVMLRRSPRGSVMMMLPWLPVEVISDNIATIDNKEIVTQTIPKESLIEYYNNMVTAVKKEAKMNGDMLAKANENYKEKKEAKMQPEDDWFEDDFYDEDEPNSMDELINGLERPTDKKQLH